MSVVADAPKFILRSVQPGQRFAGAFDFVNEALGLRGWVVDIVHPGRAVALSAVAGGTVLASVHAMIDRPEIDKVLGRISQAGFLLGWSRFDAERLAAVAARDGDAPIAVRIDETGDFVECTTVPITAADALAALRRNPKGDRQSRFSEVHDYHAILDSALFDEAWYRDSYAALVPLGLPPILDYVRSGEVGGRRPNYYFDPLWYARRLARPTPKGALAHYIRSGEAAGSPSVHFDEAWYRATWPVPAGTTALADYLGHLDARAPNRWFDRAWYLAQSHGNADDAADLYHDFATIGFEAGTFPSERLRRAAAAGRLDVEAAAYLTGIRRESDPTAPAFAPDPALAAEAARAAAAAAGQAAQLAAAAPPPTPPAAAAQAPPLPAPAAAAQASPLPAPAAAAPPAPAAKAPPPPASAAQAPPPPASAARAPAPPSPAAPAPFPDPAAPASRDWAAFGAGVARPLATPPPPPPPPSGPGFPPAARIGWAAAERQLAALPPDVRREIFSRAEARLAAGGEGRADAAVLVAIARAGERQTAAAARAAAAYLGEPPVGEASVRGEIETRLLALAHELYESRAVREAEEVYRLVFARGRRDDLLVLRLTETAVDRGDVAAAGAYVAILRDSREATTNPWAAVAMARFHLLRHAKSEAARVLCALPPFPATPAIAESVAINLLINSDAVEAAAQRAEASAEDRAPALFAAHFRLAVWRADARTVARMVADERAAELPNWQLGEAMFRLAAPGRVPLAQQHAVMASLFRLTEGRGLADNAIVQARLHYLLHSKKWDELAALFAELDRTPAGQARETLLRKLEFAAHSGDAVLAEEIYRAHFATSELNKWESLTVLRLLSELKRWDEAGEVLLRHVAGGYDFGAGGHIAMRVVRKARLHEQALSAREGARGLVEPPLDAFLALVNEDMAILNRAISLSPKARTDGAPARPMRYRSNWILEGGPGETSDEYCMFICTNQRYFLSALTFLTSFFGQAPQVDCRIFAFLDNDVPRHWHGMFAMVAARFNRTIEIVGESEFVTTAAEHRIDYGFFAGGSNLARAAYYRLYAARWLLEKHTFRRAAYIDTDIICRGDLSGLFELEFGDSLVSAAIEDYSIEVVNAAGRNNIDPFKYFNSGVLALRMDDPRLKGAIEDAIRVSEKEPQRLSFHDQCALNIAFQGKSAPLPPRFNFYLRPSRERNGYLEDGLLLHFVDRPKPWDIVFDRSYREEWRVWALMLGTFLPQGLYVDIFSAANRD